MEPVYGINSISLKLGEIQHITLTNRRGFDKSKDSGQSDRYTAHAAPRAPSLAPALFAPSGPTHSWDTP